MANRNGDTDVATTPSKEQEVNGQNEATEEDGVNGQQPDSMCSCMFGLPRKELMVYRHFPGHHQASSRAIRDANDGASHF